MNQPVARRIRVRVPGSTSNLGAGFDCIGLALTRYVIVEFERAAESGISFSRKGTVASLPDQSDLVRTTLLAELAVLGRTDVGGHVAVTSDIPVGRGLGSSAAAAVAGLALAHAIAGERTLNHAALLQKAERLEGHPDNAAPALLGGLAAVTRDKFGKVMPLRLPLSDRIGFAFAAPDYEVATLLARKALPREVEHAVAARSLGRLIALQRGLAEADPDLIGIGFGDELHVPYRLPLISGASRAFEMAMGAGAWAATISGAGSGLIAACPRGEEPRIARAMAEALQQPDITYAFPAEPDLTGTAIEFEE
jgi:homoserine kinase